GIVVGAHVVADRTGVVAQRTRVVRAASGKTNIGQVTGDTDGRLGVASPPRRAEVDGHRRGAERVAVGHGSALVVVPALRVPAAAEIVLFDVGQDQHRPGDATRPVQPAGRQALMAVVEVVDGQTDLFEVVRASRAGRRLTNFLDGGK